MIRGSFLLARKRRPGTKPSIFERSDLVCTQSKTQPGRTTCSRQSLAARQYKIPASTCGSQELYHADWKSKHHQGNLVLGQLPTRTVIGVVDNDAYNRVITKSPFHFKHNSINFMTLCHDGVQIPAKLLQPDFANDRSIRSYPRLFSQTGQYYRDTGNNISREQYKNGCALFAFDLTSQMDSGEVGFELIKHGNICIEIRFANATARTLTILVFAEHDNLLKID